MHRKPWSYVLDGDSRILFADDDPILVEFAKVHLSTPTTVVESAKDGLEAWHRLCTESFDLVLIDIVMPGLDGFSLVERIRADEKLRHLPLVMVTGHEDVVSIDRAFAAGATSFVTKPVNWRLLSHQLRYVLRTTQMAAEVREARNRAEAASAMKTNMLSLLQHEIRTPLHTIMGFARILKEKAATCDRSGQLEEFSDHIVSGGETLRRTFAQVQKYAALVTRQYELREDEYQLSTILTAATMAVATDVETRLRLIPLPDTGPSINIICDRDLLETMLAGVLDNAIVHGGGSSVSIDVEQERSQDLLIAIRDEGPGMTAKQREAAMLPFGQAQSPLTRSTNGLGLGIPIAQEIVRLHEGALNIDSRPGGGTTVRIRLPARRIIAARPDPAPSCASSHLLAVAGGSELLLGEEA
jgi:two-component system, sensor histidine kinase and response regulator